MDKKIKIGRLGVICAVLIVVVVGVVLFNSVQRTAHVILPTDTSDGEQITDTLNPAIDAVNAITVSVDTVQDIVATLHRSDYRRTVRIEQVWTGGSGTRELTVTQVGDLHRIDELLSDGRTQTIVSTAETYYLFMDDGPTVYETALGDFTVDQLEGIPTYEDVLDLAKRDILETSYDEVSGIRCIYVATAVDDQGYQSRYWISVDSGLLVAAERLENDQTIYRVAVVAEEVLSTTTEYFILPDGTNLQEDNA